MIRRLVPDSGPIENDEDLENFYLRPHGRHLRVDFVVSIDGMVEIGGRARPLGGPADKAAFQAMRAVADAVMVGAGTARIERYGPVELGEAARERRKERGQEPIPPLVVVSRRGALSTEDRLFTGDHRPILVTTAQAVKTQSWLGDVADVLECGPDEVDLDMAFEVLEAQGLERIVCEGGPALLSSLLARDLVDEMCVTFSPMIAGPQHLTLSGERPLAEPSRFRLQGLLEGDGLLLARYERDRNAE